MSNERQLRARFHVTHDRWMTGLSGPSDVLDPLALEVLPKRRRLGKPAVLRKLHTPDEVGRSTWVVALQYTNGKRLGAEAAVASNFLATVHGIAVNQKDSRIAPDPLLEIRNFNDTVLSATVAYHNPGNDVLLADVGRPVDSLSAQFKQEGVLTQVSQFGVVAIEFGSSEFRLRPDMDKKQKWNAHAEAEEVDYVASGLSSEQLLIAHGALTAIAQTRERHGAGFTKLKRNIP